ncbi:MAG: hypothetical protein JW725_04760 [Candidatus Babeliaceae bacterium]|nr:hypothetical protein [Candidatus Babeliaceae bacterium]
MKRLAITLAIVFSLLCSTNLFAEDTPKAAEVTQKTCSCCLNNKLVWIGGTVISLAALGALAYYFYTQQTTQPVEEQQSAEQI